MHTKLTNKKIIIIFLTAALSSYAIFTATGYIYCDGFNSEAVTPRETSFEEKWNTPLSLEALSLLKQPFYYTGQGSQSFVFTSADGEWVLKFFRIRRLYPSFFSKYFQKETEIRRKEKKRNALFESCFIAYTQLRQECALSCLHLNPTKTLHTQILVYDKLERPHFIDADRTPFLIQKKATPLYFYLFDLAQQQQFDLIQKTMDRVSELLMTRLNKGINDNDPEIHKNLGVISNNNCIFLDVGSFDFNHRALPSCDNRFEIDCITRKCTQWIKTLLPLEPS